MARSDSVQVSRTAVDELPASGDWHRTKPIRRRLYGMWHYPELIWRPVVDNCEPVVPGKRGTCKHRRRCLVGNGSAPSTIQWPPKSSRSCAVRSRELLEDNQPGSRWYAG